MENNLKEEIWNNDIHIATIVRPNLTDDGLSFFTSDENFIQVGIWNYEKGKVLPNPIGIMSPKSLVKASIKLKL